MCKVTVTYHRCGCPGKKYVTGCALPSRLCEEHFDNPGIEQLDTLCNRHEVLRRRRTPTPPQESIDPAFRSQPAPTTPTPKTVPRPRQYTASPAPAATFSGGSNSAAVSLPKRRSPAPASGVPRRRPVPNRAARESTPPRVYGAMRNIAQDLQDIDMPQASGESYSPPGGRARSNLRNVSEVPHIPVLPISPRRRRDQRESSPLLADAGVGAHRSPRSRAVARASLTNTMYEEAAHQAKLQRHEAVRQTRELYEQCERLVMTGRFSREQLLQHRMVRQLSERERNLLLRAHEASVSAREEANPRGVRHMRTWEESSASQKGRCVVL